MHNCSLRNHMHPEHFDLGKILQSYLNTVQDYFIYITSPCTIVMFPLTNFLFYPFFIRFSLSLSLDGEEKHHTEQETRESKNWTLVQQILLTVRGPVTSAGAPFLSYSYTVVSNNLTFRVKVKKNCLVHPSHSAMQLFILKIRSPGLFYFIYQRPRSVY